MPFGTPQQKPESVFMNTITPRFSFSRKVPIATFRTWKYFQDDRNRYVGRKPDIDLSNEKTCVYLHIRTIKEVIDAKPEYIVVRFICEGATNLYSNLSVVFCGMTGDNIVTDVYDCHLITLPDINQIDVISNPNWHEKASNFVNRNILINTNQYSNYFKTEVAGIAHRLAEFDMWFNEELGEGMKEVALHFVKDPYKTTIVFVNSEFGGKLLNDIDLFDFGQACCPPQ